MTDSDSAHHSRIVKTALSEAGICQRRTRPYTSRTNGKAERFIQTSLRLWAYAALYDSSAERAVAMPAWICACNSHRLQAALDGKPPTSRIKDHLLQTTVRSTFRHRLDVCIWRLAPGLRGRWVPV
ncbi:transposase [Micromonospora sp. STR1s_5]|nr:transposase [Micromonospora sp. STR1s_5]